ncbi:MAG: transcriptional regulator, TetR family [Phenylobacterium sp.]|nr:transcriptional regulator, TetR family [Phenylobacterium sp.]
MTAAGTTTRRSSRKAKGDGYLRRAEILEAAERIFVVDGYDGATIRKIADEVGVSSTALYMHFPDKSAILLEICERTIEVLLERNRDLAAKPIDPVVRVKMMLEAYMRWAIAHPNAYQLVYSVPRPATATWAPDAAADLSAQCYDIFAGVVREIAAVGRLRNGSADAAAQALWMCCHGVVALLAARPNFGWADREELIRITLDGLINGHVVD